MESIIVLGIVAIAFSCFSIESSLRTTKKQNQEIIDLLRELKNKRTIGETLYKYYQN